ncbi:uncharacterized protein BDZ99DRAFT_84685 [Mytilinidion resinicola]|uniref:Uncharacterized protein n=1 Tax=Mytilinidion resinicola TaxID=574789 RepID=A0A6A6YDE2_9PEZI|nr:uncharacterized protein BDZ99DRAFT_84685 [Mytilinidion resinicola]KAF2806740.1 hypothetical protein BDZ99DRAFT_84685 [Mytilinidion resinicola]
MFCNLRRRLQLVSMQKQYPNRPIHHTPLPSSQPTPSTPATRQPPQTPSPISPPTSKLPPKPPLNRIA